MPSADTETRDDRRAGGRAGGLPPPRRRRAAGGGQGGGELRCPALQVTPRPLLLDIYFMSGSKSKNCLVTTVLTTCRLFLGRTRCSGATAAPPSRRAAPSSATAARCPSGSTGSSGQCCNEYSD